MPKKTPFNTYPGSNGGWVYPTREQIDTVCSKMKPLEEWRKPYARNPHKPGSHQTVSTHIGLTAIPVAQKREGKQRFSWPQWVAMCMVAGIELNIPEIKGLQGSK